jgi:DNA replication protein DnaC
VPGQPWRLRDAGSVLVTSQLPVERWYESADAILDRTVHNAHHIDLAGDSMRKTRKAEPNA